MRVARRRRPGGDDAPDAASDGRASSSGSCGVGSSDPSLVVYLPFDDGVGTKAADCSGNGHDGNIPGTPKWVAGKKNGALELDGSTTCVDLGTADAVKLGKAPFTVAAWINVARFPSSTSANMIISRSTVSTKGWRFATDFGGVYNVTLYQSSTDFTVSTADHQPTGRWTHVAMTFTPGGTVGVYVDGVNAANDGPAPTLLEDALASTLIGCRAGGNHLDGTLDELRIYSRVLASNEIAALAQ